jgi:tetratricopeptide (TPR) repeat protein
LYITGHYDGFVTGDLEKASELYRQWLQVYPRDNRPLSNLALQYQTLGENEKALETATHHLSVIPGDHYGYQNQMSSYLYMNRWDEAKAVGDTATGEKKDTLAIHAYFMYLAAAKADEAEMRRHLAWASGKAGEANLTVRLFSYQDAAGRIKLSRQTAQQALLVGQKFGFNELGVNLDAAMATRDAFHGFSEDARQKATELLRLSDERGARGNAAIALAQVGETSQAEKLINDLDREYPSDTLNRFAYSPVVKALVLLHRNEAVLAVAALEPARNYDLASPISNITFAGMYVRGLAYLQAKDGVKAGGEFQKILDHNGLNTASVFLPLAQLNLARSYALQGETAKARRAYQDFFAIWKDADADVPALVTAKAEYAKLK